MLSNGLPSIHSIKKEIFDKIWKLVDEKYVLFGQKNINWDQVKVRYEMLLSEIDSYEDLYEHIDRMLLELRDPHTRIVFTPYIKNLGVMSLVLRCINGDYYIVENLNKGNLLKGMRLISIDDIPIHVIERKVQDRFHFGSKSARITSFLKEYNSGKLGKNLRIKAVSNTGDIVDETVQFMSFDRKSLNTSDVERVKTSFSLCQTMEYEINIGYIKILNFRDRKVVHDFESAISRFCTKEFLIIDVRDNDGGLIESAVDIAATILKDDLKIGKKYHRKAGGTHNEFEAPEPVLITAKNRIPEYKKIVILCNEFTLSAAEFIFIQALKGSSSRITVIGNRTGGLPHSASLFTLFDGTKVQITTCKYLNLEGNAIAENGILGDIEVFNTPQILTDNKDLQLEYALNYCRH